MMKRVNKIFLITIFFLALGANLWSTDYVWKKTNVSDSWDTSNNWVPTGVPGVGDNVTIPEVNSGRKYPVFSNTITIENLTIESNAELLVWTTGTLRINKSCENNGSITIGNQAKLICKESFSNNVGATLTAGDTSKATLTISKDFKNNGTVNLKQDTNLTLSGDFINNGNFNGGNQSIVYLTPANNTVTITGIDDPTKTQFNKLEFLSGAGKKLIIDGKITVTGTFDFRGADGNRLKIDGKNYAAIYLDDNKNGSEWLAVYKNNVFINDGGGATKYTPSNSIGYGESVAAAGTYNGWVLGGIEVSPTKRWQGGAGSDGNKWEVASNWNPEGVPDATMDVIIPKLTVPSPKYPVISTSKSVKSLTIDLGAALTFNAGVLIISEKLENNAENITGARLMFSGSDSKITGTEEIAVSVLLVNNAKKLTLENNIIITDSFKNNGTFDAHGNKVTIVPNGTSVKIQGRDDESKTMFQDLVMTGQGGKTLKIEAKITVDGDLKLSGDGTNKLTIQKNDLVVGSPVGEIYLTKSQSGNGQYLKVYTDEVKIEGEDVGGVAYDYTVKNSVDHTGTTTDNNGWIFETPATPATARWNGSTDSNWNDPDNWDGGQIPGTNTVVTIPGTCSNYPNLSGTTDAKAESVTVDSGATLDLADQIIKNGIGGSDTAKVTVKGTLRLYGTNGASGTTNQVGWFKVLNVDNRIVLEGASTVEYYGTSSGKVWNGEYHILKIAGATSVETETGAGLKVKENFENAGTFTLNADMEIEKTFTDNGTFDATTNSKKVTFIGASGSIPSASSTTFYDLEIANGKRLGINKAITVSHNLTAKETSTLNVHEAINVGNNLSTASGCRLSVANAVTVNNDFTNAGRTTVKANITVTNNLTNSGELIEDSNLTTKNISVTGLFTNNGTYNVTANVTVENNFENTNNFTLNGDMTLKGDFTNSGTFTAGSGRVTLSSDNDHKITGTSDASKTQFNNLQMGTVSAGAGGHSLTIKNKISVTGNLLLNGSSESNHLTVKGSGTVASPNSEITLGSNQSGRYLSVDRNIPIADTGSYKFTARESSPIGTDEEIHTAYDNLKNWVFTSKICAWTGAGNDKNWNNRKNWEKCIVPTEISLVMIQNGKSPYPDLAVSGGAGADAKAKKIIISSNASLDLDAQMISSDTGGAISTTIKNSGTIILTGTNSNHKAWFVDPASPTATEDNKISLLANSTVIYTGNSSDQIWAGPYENLEFENTRTIPSSTGTLVVNKTFTNKANLTMNTDCDLKSDFINESYATCALTADMTIAGNFDNKNTTSSPASFKATNRTIKFTGGSSQLKTSSLAKFHNLTIASGETIVNDEIIVAETTLVDGNLTINAEFTSKNLTINSPRTLTANAEINLTGDFINYGITDMQANMNIAGDFTSNGSFYENNSTVTFNGTSSEITSGSLGTVKFYNLEIANTSTTTINKDITVANDFTNEGTTNLNTDMTLKGDFTNSGTFTASSGRVTLSSDNDHKITGTSDASNTQFSNLQMGTVSAGAGGHSLTIEKKITVTGNLELAGSDSGNPLTVTGNGAASEITLSNNQNGQYLSVSTNIPIADTGSYKFTARESKPSGDETDIIAGKPSNWIFTSETCTWTGSKDTSWKNPGNWENYVTPTKISEVTIPNGKSNYPDLAAVTDAKAKKIIIENTASLDLDGQMILSDDASTSAPTTIKNSGTIILTGTNSNHKTWFVDPASPTATEDNKISLLANSTVIYTGNFSDQIWAGTYENLEIQDTRIIPFSAGALKVDKTFTVNGTVTLNRKLTTKNLTIETGKELLAGADIEISHVFTNGNKFTAGDHTVSFNGSSASISGSDPKFNNLTIASGTLTPGTDISVKKAFANNGNFEAGGYTVSFTSADSAISGSDPEFNNLTITGTLTSGIDISVKKAFVNNGTFTAGTHTVKFIGGSASISGSDPEFNNLKIASGTLTPAINISVSGTFTSNGTFNANSKKVTFTGGSAEIANGSESPINFYDLEISDTSTTTVNETIKVNNDFVNKGTTKLNTNMIFASNFTNNGTFTAKANTTITLTNDKDHTIRGDSSDASKTSFANLSMTSSNKILNISGKIKVAEDLDLSGSGPWTGLGTADSKFLKIRRSDTNPAVINLGKANQTVTLAKVDTENITITGNVPCKLRKSVDVGSEQVDKNGWCFFGPNNLKWVGSSVADGTNWFNHENWNEGASPTYEIPASNTEVEIPAGAAKYPKLTKDASAKSVSILSGASLDINDFKIFISTDGLTKNDTTISNAGTLRLTGKASKNQKSWFTSVAGTANKITLDENSTVVYYSDESSNIWAGDYANLEFEDTRTIPASTGTVTVNKNLINRSNLTVETDINLDGNLTNENSFTTSTGKSLILNAGKSHTITGLSDASKTQFTNLKLGTASTGAGGQSLTIKNKISITGDLLLNGSGTSQRLTVNGSGTKTAPTAEMQLSKAQRGNGKFLSVASNIPIAGKTYTAFDSVRQIPNDGPLTPKNWVFEVDGVEIKLSLIKVDKNELYIKFSKPVGKPIDGAIEIKDNTNTVLANSTAVVAVGSSSQLWKFTLNKNITLAQILDGNNKVCLSKDITQFIYINSTDETRPEKVHISDIGFGVIKVLNATNSRVIHVFDGTKILPKLNVAVTATSEQDIDKFTLYFSKNKNSYWVPDSISHSELTKNPNTTEIATGDVNSAKKTKKFIILKTGPYFKQGSHAQFMFVYNSWLPCERLAESSPIFQNDGTVNFDVWRFMIEGVSYQRGNVSIFNNVVNPEKSEEVSIEVKQQKNGILTIQVMTLDGSIVKTIERSNKNAGVHLYHWNGKNLGGSSVARGMYFIRIVGPNIDEVRKVMIVK